ncbi:uncharacterized protein EDB93DRAFT_1090963 [Suillus bovinus]|uniref:uncharacterized protein n=1 Tax=Suillus bovinus TaxID=48563 RepID=UPI001B86BC82|nr:uncharacterized protein EDB93DRAFT_1090963 [Suillus bovinus]KAG2137881.1 hypothetical protein EDB93DRAFT_1090963 [Suillus bovinus]
MQGQEPSRAYEIVCQAPTTDAKFSVSNANAKLSNPLNGIPYDRLMADVEIFAEEKGLTHLLPELEKGALLAQDPTCHDRLDKFSQEDKRILTEEVEHKWRQTPMLYYMVVMSSLAAAVQGMDEAVINGAQIIYPKQFSIGDPNSKRDSWLVGLVNSAPYLCCATISCWMTHPLNHYLGRKKTIFVTCLISFLTCIWSALTNSWWHLFISRFFLGFGIGPKSTTVPVYTAECSPAPIRGALVMMWQMWTAFGIALGDLVDLVFYFIPDTPGVTGLNWRLMLGSAGVPGLIVCLQILFAPESPRWLISRGRYEDAFNELCRLRFSHVQAARDLYYIHVLLEAENEMEGRNRIVEMFAIPRNRHAAVASWVVMFGQQFCGLNVIAYYSSNIFLASGLTQTSALTSSLVFGTLNWLFALPAVFTIDTFGRRNLLLFTFPCMAICLLVTGFSFSSTSETGRIAGVSIGIYLFTIFYSSGEGPVPFTYSAEAFPLYIRDVGMSFATATTWFWNFVLSITWPWLILALKPQGAFSWYAAWCCILWVLILLLVRETKDKTLEELDQVFSIPLSKHVAYGLRQIPYGFKKFVLFQKPDPEQLYQDGNEREVPNTEGEEKARGEVKEDPEKTNV